MPTLSIELSENERRILLGAMCYLIPVGGGSYHRNLTARLEEALGELTPAQRDEQNQYYWGNMLTDYMDASDGTIASASKAFGDDLARKFPNHPKE